MTGHMDRFLLFIGTGTSLVVACLGLETCSSTPLGWVLVFTGVGLCMVGTLNLAASMRQTSARHPAPDRWLWLFVAGLLAVGLVASFEYLYLPASLPRNEFMLDAGLVLFGAGLTICLWARCLLVWRGARDESGEADARWSRAGAYHVMRYPGYVGLGLMALGLGIGFASLISVLVWGLLLLPVLLYRAKGWVATIGALSVLVGPVVGLSLGRT
ncbi:MAG: hypothetical protein KKA73_08850 [Chloroflexi bacterium]|nr:hypothetical protein [Chloroflexota bacterium]MBU1747785.1 hypothetical protein [Chloroflexota bacterium]